ncbi:MAG: hypothetical protein AABX05_02325 [Nanoarchaeota archaeon]
MQSVLLYLPEQINTDELHRDLEKIIITGQKGRFIRSYAFASSYAVTQERIYELPGQGTIITVTNDFNAFRREAPHVPGVILCYSAEVLFSGFNEYSLEFERLKDQFSWLNQKYPR